MLCAIQISSTFVGILEITTTGRKSMGVKDGISFDSFSHHCFCNCSLIYFLYACYYHYWDSNYINIFLISFLSFWLCSFRSYKEVLPYFKKSEDASTVKPALDPVYHGNCMLWDCCFYAVSLLVYFDKQRKCQSDINTICYHFHCRTWLLRRPMATRLINTLIIVTTELVTMIYMCISIYVAGPLAVTVPCSGSPNHWSKRFVQAGVEIGLKGFNWLFFIFF